MSHDAFISSGKKEATSLFESEADQFWMITLPRNFDLQNCFFFSFSNFLKFPNNFAMEVERLGAGENESTMPEATDEVNLDKYKESSAEEEAAIAMRKEKIKAEILEVRPTFLPRL